MENKKLIRGVIYDDPSVVNNAAYITAGFASVILDNKDEYFEKASITDDQCPNRDELLAYSIIKTIRNPIPNLNNLIIPAELLNNKLYKDLSRIDIGPAMCQYFKEIREEQFEENNKVEEKGNDVFTLEIADPKTDVTVAEFHFSSREDLIEFAKDNLDVNQYKDLMKQIQRDVA